MTMEDHEVMGMWCQSGPEVQKNEIETYASTLIDARKKDRDSRRRRQKGKKSGAENKLLLVYPLKVDETVLVEASRGLSELGGETLGVHEASNLPGQSQNSPTEAGDNDEGSVRELVIREKDRKLLAGEMFNDTLVDFWMRWISRGENPQNSSVHFFPAQFYGVLHDGGPEAVASWTASIDIFKKKFVFVPIKKDLHWSLCVIVNSGEIAKMFDEAADDCEHPWYVYHIYIVLCARFGLIDILVAFYF